MLLCGFRLLRPGWGSAAATSCSFTFDRSRAVAQRVLRYLPPPPPTAFGLQTLVSDSIGACRSDVRQVAVAQHTAHSTTPLAFARSAEPRLALFGCRMGHVARRTAHVVTLNTRHRSSPALWTICIPIMVHSNDHLQMLWHNVVCCGGSTMFRGFGERLAKELRTAAPSRLEQVPGKMLGTQQIVSCEARSAALALGSLSL